MAWYPSSNSGPRPKPGSDPDPEDTAVTAGGDDDPTVSDGHGPDARFDPRDDQPTIARHRTIDEETRTFEDDDPTVTRPALARTEPAAELLDSRYQLLGQIGAGGMGEVWRARHVQLARDVAIKFLTNEEGSPRFKQEAQAIAAIRHTGVVDVLDFGETRRRVPYFVMELLEGETLSARVRRTGPLSWALVRNIALEVSDALAHAHAVGVIHRDLKPSNVVVLDNPPPRGSSTKLIDFGIAKLLDSDGPALTKNGYIQGTPAYMAPEQVLGEPVDARTDVYGLGCLLYFLLAGQRLFADQKGAAALQAQLEQTPPRFAELAEDLAIPPDVEAVVLRALAKDKSARFESMDDFHRALLSIPPDASASMSGPGPATKRRPATGGVASSSSSSSSGDSLRTTASYSAQYDALRINDSSLDDEMAVRVPRAPVTNSVPAVATPTEPDSRSGRERTMLALMIIGSISLVALAVISLIWALRG